MSKPTTEDMVQVYNALTRAITCHLPVEQLEKGARRPPKMVVFKPGNNEVDLDAWVACNENASFRTYLESGSYPEMNGRFRDVTPIVEGKFDRGQAAQEADLARKIEKERARLSAGD